MYVILEEVGDYYKYNKLYTPTVYTNLAYVQYLVNKLNSDRYDYAEVKLCTDEYVEPEDY